MLAFSVINCISLILGILMVFGVVRAEGVPTRVDETARYRAIVERPLFRPGRRPEPVATVLDAAEPLRSDPEPGRVSPVDPDLAFLGTVRHNGRIVALVALPGRSTPLRLTVGSEVAGWRVTRVEPTRLVIETDTAYEEYTILE